MQEEKVKKRGWVKNAAIIFLAVMLVLTFFSNTIMNRSLPEVSTQYATSGSITAQIRGTSTVEAVETYEVKILETRTVKTVAAKVGNTVVAGDVLFILADGEGTELSEAQDALEAAQLSYQRKLLSASDTDYTRENRDIQKLRDSLAADTAEREALGYFEVDYNNAKSKASTAQILKDAAQGTYDAAVEDLGTVTSGDADYSGVQMASEKLSAAKAAETRAKNELATGELVYGNDYDTVVWVAKAAILLDATDTEKTNYKTLTTDAQKESFFAAKLPVYLPLAAKNLNGYWAKLLSDDPYWDEFGAPWDGWTKAYDEPGKDYLTAYTTIASLKEAVAEAASDTAAAQSSYNSAYNSWASSSSDSSLYNKYKKAVDSSKAALDTAKRDLTAAENALAVLEEKRTAFNTLTETIDATTTSLEDKLFELSEAQKTDKTEAALFNLDLQELAGAIADAKEKVEKLKTGASSGEITSPVDGVIKSVGISAGGTTEYNQVIATIEVTSRGYSCSMSVTVDQSRKVTVGDYATVSTGWWGSSNIEARLAAIRTDPQKPRENKLLVFEMTGEDITSGDQLTLSIGQKSASYDIIVPNSAVRSDSNGSFVYILAVKSSPLGNRYSAQRADVQVLASDDTMSAVSGGVGDYDYVITNSTAPIENGMLVRMADT